MRALLIAAAFLVGSAVASPASGPYPGDFELGAYRFVSEVDDATSIFLNPAGLAVGHGTNLYFELSGDEDVIDETVVGIQGGASGFIYRHRDLSRGNLDSYLLASGFGPPSLRGGLVREWTNSDRPGADLRAWHAGLLSRPDRRLSIGARIEALNRPDYLGGELAPRYTYGLSVRPLPGVAEAATFHFQGSHLDGSSRVDLAYGVRVSTPGGLDVGLTVQDPNGESPHFGAAVSTYWGNGTLSLRARRPIGDQDVRWQTSLHLYDEFWRRSMGSRRVATLRMGGTYTDEASGFVLLGGETRGARDVIRRLRDASEDRDIRALAIHLEGFSDAFLGPVTAHLEEIRAGLLAFRASGKPVVAYLGQMANGPAEVYMASAADRVVLTPLGGVHSFGVSLHLTRQKEFFEKLGVSWDADTAGVYKSSFHGFYTDSTSPAQAELIQGLVDHAYDYLVQTVGASRRMDADALADLSTGRVVFPEECVTMGIVDTLGWWEDALKMADRLSGGDGDRVPRSIPLPRRRYWDDRWAPAPAVAVVPAAGSIRSGNSGHNWLMGGRSMGSRTVARQIRSAAAHPAVRAVVLRVDSGGGSALASEEIRQALLQVKKRSDLPLLVSMGNAAASGGYWISMDADTILANRMTRTGSIGVVWAVPVVEDLYRKMGLHSETFKRGEHADMFSTARRFTDDERDMLDASLDYTYDWFVRGVAAGRGIPEPRVREIAQGKLYFGEQARELGLVDGIGSLDDAVALAAQRAGIEDDFRVLTFRPRDGSRITRALRFLAGVGKTLGSVLPLGGSGVEVAEGY